jgi:hypothetical protein
MLYCAQDLIEYLMATTGGGVQDSEHRALRASAANGYRDVINTVDWNYHDSSIAIPGTEFLKNDQSQPFEMLLPDDCKNVDMLVAPDRTTPCCYCTLQEYNRLLSYDTGPGSTIFWTVTRDSKHPDRNKLMLGGRQPPIYEDGEYLLTYRRKPKDLRYFGYEKACRDAQAIPSGCVIRWGSPTQYPEGPYGIHPYVAEAISGSPDTLQGEPPEGGRTVFSDYLDISQTMYSAMLSACEVWYARLAGRNVEGALTVHMRDMKLAMEQDGMNPMSGRRTYTYRYPEGMEMPYASTGIARRMGYYSPEQSDTGTNINPSGGSPNNTDPNRSPDFLTTDKPHSIGHSGAPLEVDEPWLSPAEVSMYGGKSPDNLSGVKVGSYRIDKSNRKWVFVGGDPKKPENWGIEG